MKGSDQLRDLLGAPPLVPGENSEAYDNLYAAVRAHFGPRDMVDEIWIRDVVDPEFQLIRLRSTIPLLRRSVRRQAIINLLLKVVGFLGAFNLDRAELLAERYVKQEPVARAEVAKILEEAELTTAAINSEADMLCLDQIERIDRMIMTLEARRDIAIRNLERRAASASLRPQQIEGAEYRAIESSGGETNST